MKKKTKIKTDPRLITPCGMNCAICSGYLAQTRDIKKRGVRRSYCAYCAGCRVQDKQCTLKRQCRLLRREEVKFCFECQKFPCERLKYLDKRYRTNFHMSMIDNLKYIQKNGLPKFLKQQEKKWRCSECGGVICCHNGICYDCGIDKLKKKKRLCRW